MESDENAVQKDGLEELDIEAFAKEHPAERRKPCARFYIIRIDRERKRVPEPELTGTLILALVGKTPQTHKLFQKFRGGRTEVVEPGDVVQERGEGARGLGVVPLLVDEEPRDGDDVAFGHRRPRRRRPCRDGGTEDRGPRGGGQRGPSSGWTRSPETE